MTSDAPAGVFITFEGGEGAGKSTQIARLAARLRALSGREIVTTREPGGTARAEQIREALLSGVAKRFGPFAEALLFSAARIDHLDRLIDPALRRGAIVLCDRFADSTRAYQGAAGGLDAAVLRALERVTLGGTRPHLTLFLDLPPETGLARAKIRAQSGRSGPDRFEAESIGFHERLRGAFRAIAESEPERCALIDAQSDADAVERAILAVVTARLPALAPRTDEEDKARDDAA